MAGKRKTVPDEDGTPVEIEATAEEIAAEQTEQAAADLALSEIEPKKPVLPYGEAKPVAVIWTELGEAEGVYSERGQHKAGDEVLTRHSANLIASGYAVEK